ncbi:MAG TPA: hypothetical protein VK679_03385 [Gemmatimonadaceae bacterium]|jgi:hypothetical protein|nr:hypothetical protein [Gemmatimonadaceae bacterium]
MTPLERFGIIGSSIMLGIGAVTLLFAIISDRKAWLRRKRSGRIFTVTVEAPFENTSTVEYARMTADEAAVVLERVHAARAAAQLEEMRELAGQSKSSQTA